jgi:hypothetical protein
MRGTAAAVRVCAASVPRLCRVAAASLLWFFTSMLWHLKISLYWVKARHKALNHCGCTIDAAFPAS